MSTLTFAYADSMAVLGPLALRAEPGTYDLCREHWARMKPPIGWEFIRLPIDPQDPRPSKDDLVALADAVREVGLRYEAPRPVLTNRRGHLAVVADDVGARR